MNPTGGTPQRGDAIIIDFNPQLGNEQAGRRPAVVLSPGAYNARVGLAIVCPITNRIKGYPFEVDVPPGLDVTGVILADHVKSLDWRERNTRVVCRLPSGTINDVLVKLNTLIGQAASP